MRDQDESDALTGAGAQVTETQPITWHRGPGFVIGSVAAVLLAAVGLLLSRPDAVALALPLALWCALVAFRPRADAVRVTLTARQDGADVIGRIEADSDADWLQVAVDQADVRSGTADARPGGPLVRTRSRLRHSGPVALLSATVRAVAADGAWTGSPGDALALHWNAAPRTNALAELPVGGRLRGLHGAHRGVRIGQGGEFHDIHPFAPGDEVRRVDWRATARLARRPGELLVRRTDTLSEATVVLALDTADDLGAVVATWGSVDPERSGVTSLDLAREAALSIADAAIRTGDRVSFYELAAGGRTVMPGSGPRHRARLRSAIAATGPSGDATRFRRTPAVPPGAVVFVMSTFFDGAAAQLALRWQASGHRVLAIDVLPPSDTARLNDEQRMALRTLSAERVNILAELRHSGIDVVRWGDADADSALRAAARRR